MIYYKYHIYTAFPPYEFVRAFYVDCPDEILRYNKSKHLVHSFSKIDDKLHTFSADFASERFRLLVNVHVQPQARRIGND